MSYKLPANNDIARFARELTAGMGARPSFDMITKWVSRNIAYDYVKAAKVAKIKGIAPDPISCWATRRGICQDIAALTVILLRAVGIRCYLCVGHAGGTYHAWVQAYVGKDVLRYDHDNPTGKPIKYTIEKVIY